MLETLLIALSLQPIDDTPITIYHPRPAQEVSMSKTSSCGDLVFEVQYTQSNSKVRGHILVKDKGEIISLEEAQSDVFDKLEYISNATVTCSGEGRTSSVLVSGVEKDTGIVDQLYQVNYLSSVGFSEVRFIGG